MKTVAILYVTREGHTQRIASAIARALASRGLAGDLIDLRQRVPGALADYCAAIICSPVHAGRHARETIAFVKSRRFELSRMPNAFVSVTLSQAGVQRRNASAGERAKFLLDVAAVTDRFIAETGWRPRKLENVAGALAYTRYNFFIRFVMKRIARASGGSTDATRDHDYTDWAALERFATGFADEIERCTGPPLVA
jgi:menaquinone-dependent protoporphyrinogen oxidase